MVIVGVGFTVIVKVSVPPGQPLADEVTVIVAIIGALVKLTAANAEIFPVPLAASPIEGVLLLQE